MFKLDLIERLKYINKQWLEEDIGSYGVIYLTLMCLSFASFLVLMDALAKYILYIDMNERHLNVLGVCILAIFAIIMIFGKKRQ